MVQQLYSSFNKEKNCNYKFLKDISKQISLATQNPNSEPLMITKIIAKKTKATTNFKASSKESIKANQRAKNSFYNSVNSTMLNTQISSKKKFSILTKLMNNGKYSSIASLIENGQTIEDPIQKSQILNKNFAAKATVQGANDNVPHLEKWDNIPSFDMINTSPLETAKITRALKQSFLSHCGIPGKFISLISTTISFSLSKLFNNLFKEGHFPNIWKVSHVTALFKQKGLKSDKKNNYRPISLMPTLSRICESVIHKRLLDHCCENNLISNKQAAYLKGDSTVHQLLYIVDKIKRSWSKGDITHGIFLDVKAAFDKVWHKGRFQKKKV